MTNASDESESDQQGIADDQLPQDLKPDDNPLAEGLDAGETAGDIGPGELLEEGKSADEDGASGEDGQGDEGGGEG